MDTKKTPEIVAPELVSYLEQMLALARQGRVVYFMSSAGAIDPETPGELAVHVGAVLSAHSQLLDERSLRGGFEATNTGLVKASEAVFSGINQEIDYRKPRFIV